LIHNHWNQKKANINAISATSLVASKLHLYNSNQKQKQTVMKRSNFLSFSASASATVIAVETLS
jgi:hypothetical protein